MDNFRQIRDNHGFSILRNNRPMQKLNRRLFRYPRQHMASISSYNNQQLPFKNRNRQHLPNGNLSQGLISSVHINPTGQYPIHQNNIPTPDLPNSNSMNMMPAH